MEASGTHNVPVIVVTGPVGAGKSTVAAAISTVLGQRDIRHVMIDQDYLRWVYPSPPGDRFAARLGFRNLAAIWPNLRANDPQCVVIADVVERPEGVMDYEQAMPGTVVTVVRLDVPMPILRRRLEGRDAGDSLAWSLNRAPELQAIMEGAGVGDLVIDVGERPPHAVAEEIVRRLGFA